MPPYLFQFTCATVIVYLSLFMICSLQINVFRWLVGHRPDEAITDRQSLHATVALFNIQYYTI